MRRFMFTGSRNWRDIAPVKRVLSELPSPSIVLVGDAPGLDALVRIHAPGFGHFVVEAFAPWGAHGPKAGPMRNGVLIGMRPETVYAFPFEWSKGTRDAIRQADAAGIPVVVIEQSETASRSGGKEA